MGKWEEDALPHPGVHLPNQPRLQGSVAKIKIKTTTTMHSHLYIPYPVIFEAGHVFFQSLPDTPLGRMRDRGTVAEVQSIPKDVDPPSRALG